MSSFFDIEIMDAPFSWEAEWQGMPEFRMGNTEPIQKVTINFASREDVRAFAELTGLKITPKTDSAWFPKPTSYEAPKNFCWIENDE